MTPTRRLLLSAALLTLVIAPFADAQRSRRAPVERVPAVFRNGTTSRSWTVNTRIQLLPRRTPQGPEGNVATISNTISLNNTDFFYPRIESCSWSVDHAWRFRGGVFQPDLGRDQQPEILKGFQGFSSVAKWSMPGGGYNSLRFEFANAVTSYEIEIDENVAREYRWPTLPWSKAVALCLEPQLLIESDDVLIRRLVDQWTNGRPQRARPYDLAKHLAREVMIHVTQINGDNLESAGQDPTYFENNGVIAPNAASLTGFFSGFRLIGAAGVARTQRGSYLDLACLCVAAWRAAGLPARIVIAIDAQETQDTGFPAICAVPEFFVARDPAVPRDVPPDPDRAILESDGEWIPFFIQSQRESASRPPPINQRWQYFGRNEDGEFLAPIAFHFQAPIRSVSAGPPAIWSWRPEPAAPVVLQALTIFVNDTPRRGDDPGP